MQVTHRIHAMKIVVIAKLQHTNVTLQNVNLKNI